MGENDMTMKTSNVTPRIMIGSATRRLPMSLIRLDTRALPFYAETPGRCGRGLAPPPTCWELACQADVHEGQPGQRDRLEAGELIGAPGRGNLAVEQRVERDLAGDRVVGVVPEFLALGFVTLTQGVIQEPLDLPVGVRA